MSQDNHQRLEHLKNDYRAVFFGTSTRKQGQRVLRDIIQMSGVMRGSFVAGQPDVTGFNEGKRTLGMAILELLDIKGYEALRDMEAHGLSVLEVYEDPFQERRD